MSSRALRRAQKSKEIEEPFSNSENEYDVIETEKQNKSLFQQFSLLAGESEDDDGFEYIKSNEPLSDEEEIRVVQKLDQKLKKKKKNLRKEKPSSDGEGDIDDFFEKHIKSGVTVNKPINDNNCPFNEALSLDSAWLDANAELKKKFGGAVGGGSSVLGEINSRALRQNPVLNRAVKRKAFKRKYGFITPRPLWPPFGPTETGLSVHLAQDLETCQEYEITESEEYQSIFEELELLVTTGDLEFLIQLIHTQPLFVDGLLLLSDAYRMQSTGDAGEIVERAMYILERILPTNLCFLDGRVRFRYSHPPNRKLHLCLFRQLQFTMKKGCWRVSLQLAKTLLALDPELDPLGARLLIDFLAIQSESFEDFDKLWIQLGHNCPLGPLPGWYFNRALRMFLDEEKEKMDHSASSDALLQACSASPGTARLLLQTLKSKIPENFPSCDYFDSDHTQIGAAKIFLSRSISLWKSPSLQKWIESSINSRTFKTEKLLDFRTVPLIHQVAIYRHSLLSDISSLNVAIPNQISSISSLNAYDPLPSECFEDENNTRGKSIIDGLRDILIGSFYRNGQ